MRLAAFLRGINVGKAKRVAMSELKTLFEELGYKNVRTILNSGNILFDSEDAISPETEPNSHPDLDRLEAGAEEAIKVKLGVACRVTIVFGAELRAIFESDPLRDIATIDSRYFVSFLSKRADLNKAKALSLQNWEPEAIVMQADRLFLWCPEGALESKLNNAVAKAMGDKITSRNWGTLAKIHALL